MKYAAVICAIVLFSGNISNAQETTGDMRGRVLLSSGKAARGARVTVTSAHLQGDRQTSTASDGVFQVFRLPPGSYTVVITAIGFAPVRIDSVQVQLGRTSGVADILLTPSPVRLGDVRISAPAQTTDPTRTTIGATLESREYSSLPSERDYKSLISILPHINSSYHGDPVNAGGSTGVENMYFIDGVNVTVPLDGATGTSLPYNFVRSVEVRTGGYEAQYGKALGAIVNAVTYTGSNDFDANVFAFFTHDALAAEARAQPVLKESTFYSFDFGARVGGPILRDRLWYSAAYNPQIERSEKIVGHLGPEQQARTAQIFAGKLTWQVKPGHVELSIFGDPATARRVFIPDFLSSLKPLNVDAYLRKLETGGITGSLRGAANIGTALFLEASLTSSIFRDNILPATQRGDERVVADFVDGTVEGGLPFISKNDQRRGAIALRGTAAIGRHNLTAGAEYEGNRDTNLFHNPGVGYVERQDSLAYTIIDQHTDGKVRSRVQTAYFQDSWRITDRLTFNPGLRWSSQSLSGESGRIAQRFPGEWQPRIGFNWQIGSSHKQRVFGSYGRYYQQHPLNLATIYYIDYTGIFKAYSGRPGQPGAILVDSANFSTRELDFERHVEGAEVENTDEFSGGYERVFGRVGKLTVRALHRNLRSTFQQAVDSTGSFVIGSAGRDNLSFLPNPVRRYSALEAGVENSWRRLDYRWYYVLSRNYGNFTGLYSTDVFMNNPGNNPGFATIHHRTNTTGLLPNDRTHVVKGSGTYRLTPGLSAGVVASWMSGTPLSEMGSRDFFPVFLSPRGTAGRTPGIWDLNLRMAFEGMFANRAGLRFVLDILHAGNPRSAVRQDMTHYRGTDESGNPTGINENYLRSSAFQPPMMARIGFEITPRKLSQGNR